MQNDGARGTVSAQQEAAVLTLDEHGIVFVAIETVPLANTVRLEHANKMHELASVEQSDRVKREKRLEGRVVLTMGRELGSAQHSPWPYEEEEEEEE